MSTTIFRGSIVKGRLLLDNQEHFRRQLERLADQPVEVIVRRLRPVRSVDQNALYWALVSSIADNSGHTKQEVHRELKMRFLRVADEPEEMVRSTASLNTAEFTEYLERIQALIAEVGL
jgi:hypothetical protein